MGIFSWQLFIGLALGWLLSGFINRMLGKASAPAA
jgi:hypothetical protein